MPLSGCIGSEGGSDPDRDRVTFEADETRTVFSDGSAAFSISPALAASEQAVCTVNDVAAESCMTDSDSGSIPFEDLPPGEHELSVEIRPADDSDAVRVVHPLEVAPVTVVVYGATPGGIGAALAAARAGQSVAILEPTRWIGGMMSGGLSKTDKGRRGEEIIGGLAAEFFERARRTGKARGACPENCKGAFAFSFEPQVAEQVFEEMVAESQVIVERSARLVDVAKDGTTIRSIVSARGDVAAEIFIDASYEGDLMALAGIPYRIGREPRQIADPPGDAAELALQEDHAGIQQYRPPLGLRVDPYLIPGDASSGTLRFVETSPQVAARPGDGDSRVMAYTYRLCVTDDPSNRIPFERPNNYDPADYEGSARVAIARAATGVNLAEEAMFKPARTAYSADPEYYKYDLNGGTTFSIDMTAPISIRHTSSRPRRNASASVLRTAITPVVCSTSGRPIRASAV